MEFFKKICPCIGNSSCNDEVDCSCFDRAMDRLQKLICPCFENVECCDRCDIENLSLGSDDIYGAAIVGLFVSGYSYI